MTWFPPLDQSHQRPDYLMVLKIWNHKNVRYFRNPEGLWGHRGQWSTCPDCGWSRGSRKDTKSRGDHKKQPWRRRSIKWGGFQEWWVVCVYCVCMWEERCCVMYNAMFVYFKLSFDQHTLREKIRLNLPFFRLMSSLKFSKSVKTLKILTTAFSCNQSGKKTEQTVRSRLLLQTCWSILMLGAKTWHIFPAD